MTMKMFRFGCYVELKEGYRPVMHDGEETNIEFVIEAKNMATADRAIEALLKGASNIERYDVFCID